MSRKKFPIEWNWFIEPDYDVPFEGNVLASGDDQVDREQEQWVRDQLDSGNEAAWCIAVVTADVTLDLGSTEHHFQGRSVIGGMSWGSERELWEDNLDDMKAEAFEDLVREIRLEVPDLRHEEEREFLLVALDQLLEENG